MSEKPKIVITDYDYGDVSVETAILEAAGAEVIALQAKNQEDLFEAARDCFGMMNQYARIGAETIAHMQQCKVIARFGVGVDIVDVDGGGGGGSGGLDGVWLIMPTYCTE